MKSELPTYVIIALVNQEAWDRLRELGASKEWLKKISAPDEIIDAMD
jgi:hypothetical protein